MSRNFDITGKSINENIRHILSDFTRENLYIGIPARVVNTDLYESMQVVDVKPVINDIYVGKDDQLITSRVLKKVFVKLQNGGGFHIKLPISVGDLVTLHWSHRDLNDFLNNDGKDVDQPVTYVAEIEDCWVTHGFGTRKVNDKPSKSDLVITGPKTEVRVKPNGDVTINTEGTSYLKSSQHTIDTDTIITKTLTVKGATTLEDTLLTEGLATMNSGVYALSYSGLSGGTAVFEVDMNITGDMTINGTVTINGVEVNGHTHTSPFGGNTGPMQ